MAPKTMQAALWYGPEEMRIEEVSVPKVEWGEVLVKIGAALTCGTDFKLFRRGHALLVKNLPSPFGHEMAGTVVDKGEGVSRFQVGDRVVAANSAPCGSCFFCQKKSWNLCPNLEFLNGAYAEYVTVPARIVSKNLYRIPDHVPFREAALTEPLACALHCIEKVALKPQETLCVIGAGPCGLLFVQLGKLAGARVICIARGSDKLEVAKKLGADHVLSILEEGSIQERLNALCPGGYGPDVVIEAAGQPATWEMAITLVRKGGRVWLYGGCAQGTKVAFDTHRIHYDEISLSGVFHHTPTHFAKSLSYIVERRVDVTSLIAGEKRLSELNQVFCKNSPDNPLKIAIIP